MPNSLPKLSVAAVGVVVAGAALVLGASAIDGETRVVATDARQVATTTTVEATTVPQDDTGVIPGQPLKVGASNDPERTGFLAWEEAFPPPGIERKQLMPVVNEAGEHIAYFAEGLGWVDLEVGNDPTFDYKVALREKQQAIQAVIDAAEPKG